METSPQFDIDPYLEKIEIQARKWESKSGGRLEFKDLRAVGMAAAFDALRTNNRDDSTIERYVTTSVRNSMVDEFRRMPGFNRTTGIAPVLISTDNPTIYAEGVKSLWFSPILNPSAALEEKELRRTLRRAKALLNPYHKWVIEAIYYLGFRQTEIAIMLDCTRSNVNQLIAKALRILGDILSGTDGKEEAYER